LVLTFLSGLSLQSSITSCAAYQKMTGFVAACLKQICTWEAKSSNKLKRVFKWMCGANAILKKGRLSLPLLLDADDTRADFLFG
jgi:hypothetical protein